MPELHVERRADGATLFHVAATLPEYPRRITDRLVHWAQATPDAVFLAERLGDGWRRLTYAEALAGARSIGQALLRRGVSAERPVMMLSGNGMDHALLALGSLYAGIPFVPVSEAYARTNGELTRLRQIMAVATPGLVFAQGAGYGRAMQEAVPADAVTLDGIGELLAEAPGDAVAAANAAVDGDTVAKLLFTSGSTGSGAKAVINTHRMLCANQAMLAATLGDALAEPPVLVDWLPWSHTFGGNHNFHMVLFHGGTLYIDPGRPAPGRFAGTVQALREIAPTIHLTVPKGWEELALALRADPALNRRFHSRLRARFYAGAALPQPLWDALEALSQEAVGRSIPMFTSLGSTETAPLAITTDGRERRAGHIGLPAPGVAAKLVPLDGKLELRLRGPNIMPGYWRDARRSAEAFDEEGYYRMGDAVAWVDADEPSRGLRFDGRLAEDFKLMSGTWVSVGPLRARLIAAMSPHVRDVVITGHDRDSVAALAVPADEAGATDPVIRAALAETLTRLAASAPGSAARVSRLAFLSGPLSIDANEVTDKGSINQAAVLRARPDEVTALYAEPPPAHVLCAGEGREGGALRRLAIPPAQEHRRNLRQVSPRTPPRADPPWAFR